MRKSAVAPLAATLLVGLTSTISASGSIGSYNCSSSSSCFSASQTGPSGASGVAIRGTATNAAGLRGNSTAASGVVGQSAAGSTLNAGVEGESTNNNGIDTAGGFGLTGFSATAPAYGVVALGSLLGVYGATTAAGTQAKMGYGIAGTEPDVKYNGTDFNAGVIGRAYAGTGVLAISGSGSQSATAIAFANGAALVATDTVQNGIGAAVVNASDTLLLENGTTDLIDDAAGKFAVDYTGNESIAGFLNAPGLNVATASQYIHANVDSGSILNATYTASNGTQSGFDFSTNGDLDLTGKLTTSSGSNARTRGQSGSEKIAYGARSTSPTIEDVGEAQLTGGGAFVRLDAALADVVDRRSNYFVFITPEGDSNQLYVTQKTPAGFVVREAHGGRSTIAFQYRLVAKPFDDDSRRLAAAPVRRRFAASAKSIPASMDLATIAARSRAMGHARPASALNIDPFERLKQRLGPAKFAAALAEFQRQHRQ